MAKPGRIYLAVDVNYLDDARVVELDDLLRGGAFDVFAMLEAKRLQSDGILTRRQLERLATRLGGDIAVIDELVRVGLWVHEDGTYRRRAWADWTVLAGQ